MKKDHSYVEFRNLPIHNKDENCAKTYHFRKRDRGG